MMVKVCGITRREDALAAAELGASAIGFIFYPKSPRYVSPERARALGEGLAVTKVGVFVDETRAAIEAVMRAANLDVAQIYGGEAPSGARVWKAHRIDQGMTAGKAMIASDDCEAMLLDGQSNGQAFDWTIAKGIQAKTIIAGGLDAWNVAEAICIAEPWGVDASSRLEISPGVKDHEKMKQFIQAAMGAAS